MWHENRQHRKNTLAVLTASTLLTLTGCGGGGSSSDSTSTPTTTSPPPQTTGQTARGVVTGFGSVFVNGMEWETDSATFMLDGEAGDESGLKVGHVVLVRGSIDAQGTARASSIEQDAEIEGTISAIGTDSITVAGLTITVNADTVFDDEVDDLGLSGLSVGDYVEISALIDADGYLATRIELENDNDDGEIEVYGQVAMLDEENFQFSIFDLVVDYSDATFDDFDGRALAEGDFVEVKGNAFGSAGELLATRIEHKDNNPFDDGDEGDEFEIEGLVGEVNSDGSFTINGVTILLGENTVFRNGSVDDIAPGIKVEAEGDLDADGNLVATKVQIKIASNIEIEAMVDATDDDSLTVLGLQIFTTDTTQFDDSSDVDESFFDLADISAGDWVEVKIFRDPANGELTAARIEREDKDDEVEITAPLEAVTDQGLLLLGIPITLSPNTELDESGFVDVDDLLANIVVGTLLEVEGIVVDGADGIEIIATEIELEDDDEFDDDD